jgi:hypothetical protein
LAVVGWQPTICKNGSARPERSVVQMNGCLML